MTVKDEIKAHLLSLPEAKRGEVQVLDRMIRKAMPRAKLWFLDGKDESGKQVTNPSIGYGAYTIEYANGTKRPFYKVGIGANTAGLSVFIMGLADKTYLPKTYGNKLGKAKVSGYCIKFKALKDIDLKVLEAVVRDRAGRE